jgi:hypothetical protein
LIVSLASLSSSQTIILHVHFVVRSPRLKVIRYAVEAERLVGEAGKLIALSGIAAREGEYDLARRYSARAAELLRRNKGNLRKARL